MHMICLPASCNLEQVEGQDGLGGEHTLNGY